MLSDSYRGNEMSVPDSVEPIVGRRAWWILDEPFEICSINWDHIWLPGVPTLGYCNRNRKIAGITTREHDSPNFNCGCGIYAHKLSVPLIFQEGYRIREDFIQTHRPHFLDTLKPRGSALSHFKIEPRIVGVVSGTVNLWGRVVEGELGYRAEFAYPKEFEEFTLYPNIGDFMQRHENTKQMEEELNRLYLKKEVNVETSDVGRD